MANPGTMEVANAHSLLPFLKVCKVLQEIGSQIYKPRCKSENDRPAFIYLIFNNLSYLITLQSIFWVMIILHLPFQLCAQGLGSIYSLQPPTDLQISLLLESQLDYLHLFAVLSTAAVFLRNDSEYLFILIPYL